MNKGKFIVIEGSDGTGKKTQLDLLIKRLRKETNYKITTLDFPQYDQTFFGKLVGRYLSGEFGQNKDIDPHLASVLYAADRWQAKPKIESAINKGRIVLSNRYVLSNIGHQVSKLKGKAKLNMLRFIEEMEYQVFGLPKEDLNIILHLPPKVAQTLVDKKGKRTYTQGKKRDIHEADLHHLQRASQMYQYLARKYPQNTTLVNCAPSGYLLTPPAIHDLIWNKIKRLINLNRF